MDDNFGMGFGSLMNRFSGFDDIERQMMDFSDSNLYYFFNLVHHNMMRGGNNGGGAF